MLKWHRLIESTLLNLSEVELKRIYSSKAEFKLLILKHNPHLLQILVRKKVIGSGMGGRRELWLDVVICAVLVLK